MNSYSTNKELQFQFLQKSSRIKKIFLTPRSICNTAGSQFFATKIRISQQTLKQNCKYFNPFSVAQASSNDENTEGRKSRWNVPFTLLFIFSDPSIHVSTYKSPNHQRRCDFDLVITLFFFLFLSIPKEGWDTKNKIGKRKEERMRPTKRKLLDLS